MVPDEVIALMPLLLRIGAECGKIKSEQGCLF